MKSPERMRINKSTEEYELLCYGVARAIFWYIAEHVKLPIAT